MDNFSDIRSAWKYIRKYKALYTEELTPFQGDFIPPKCNRDLNVNAKQSVITLSHVRTTEAGIGNLFRMTV